MQLENLKNNTNSAIEFANQSLDDMKKCVEENTGNVFTVGACLGGVALRTEMKGAVFVTQSGMSVRIRSKIGTRF